MDMVHKGRGGGMATWDKAIHEAVKNKPKLSLSERHNTQLIPELEPLINPVSGTQTVARDNKQK